MVASDCVANNFGGHLPDGFACRGFGTGVGICAKPGDGRLISYDVQGGTSGYCHLDWKTVSQDNLRQTFQYLKCEGSNPECSSTAFGDKLR
jgi:hypothetical protein